jgi:hypothetical protein
MRGVRVTKMENYMEQIIAAVIGGLLAAGTGVFLQSMQERSRVSRLKQSLIRAIQDDLNLAVVLYDKIVEEWDKSQIVWFNTVNELLESRLTVVNNRDSLVLFDDDSFRLKVFKYYNKSFQLLSTIQNSQQQKYNIESKFNEILRDVKIKDARLSHEKAVKTTVSLMPDENNNLAAINRNLPENIAKVKDLKIEAKEILACFSQLKL